MINAKKYPTISKILAPNGRVKVVDFQDLRPGNEYLLEQAHTIEEESGIDVSGQDLMIGLMVGKDIVAVAYCEPEVVTSL